MKLVRTRTGKSRTRQAVEILRLRFGPQRIQNDEYFDLRLFDPAMTASARREYLGRWTFDRVYRIQDPADKVIADDKLRGYRLFRQKGFAYPAILAILHPDETFPDARSLRGHEEMTAWLKNEAIFPLFVKPAYGNRGYGSRLLEGLDKDEIILGDGERVGLEDFAKAHDFAARGALIFQEKIVPHPDLAARIGDRTATARVTILNDRPDPEIWRASLRIPVGSNMTDSFGGGSGGNLLARMNRETGILEEIIAALGIDRRMTDTHPDTGGMLKGFAVPGWQEAVKLVDAASREMAGLKIHCWDVAFSDRGPLLVEANARGDYPQHANSRGLAEPRFLELYPEGRI